MESHTIIYKPNAYLDKLDKIMGADLSKKTPTLMYMVPDNTAKAWIATSILASPYIVWILFRLKRFGWVVSFFLFVVLPYIIGFSFVESELLRLCMVYLPLLNLTFYFFLLKQTYPGWREPIFVTTPGSDFK